MAMEILVLLNTHLNWHSTLWWTSYHYDWSIALAFGSDGSIRKFLLQKLSLAPFVCRLYPPGNVCACVLKWFVPWLDQDVFLGDAFVQSATPSASTPGIYSFGTWKTYWNLKLNHVRYSIIMTELSICGYLCNHAPGRGYHIHLCWAPPGTGYSELH